MNRMRNTLVGAGLVGAMALGGAIGPVLFSAGSAGAATSSTATPTTTSTAAAPASGQFHSNESASHEQGESAAREAAENNGTATYGPGPGANSTAPGGTTPGG